MFLCETCGTQFADSGERPPAACPICEDERQYVPAAGQRWTTLDAVREGRAAEIRELEPRLTGIGLEPAFAIGQRALLVESAGGNVLWDCLPLHESHADFVRARGGLSAIAISHPHYYTTMVEWAHAFDCPIVIHEAERDWVQRPDPAIELWSGETRELLDGLTLLRLGGHFDGGQVLHWRGGADGNGALLSGDIVQVVPGGRWVSFMYGYPTLIPLAAREVERIAAAVEPWQFERIYGAWWDRVVPENGKAVVRRSAERYVRALS
jgi:glyoxylase-like metal-dependent hydrolase (beta-lactamase superfamily II)